MDEEGGISVTARVPYTSVERIITLASLGKFI